MTILESKYFSAFDRKIVDSTRVSYPADRGFQDPLLRDAAYASLLEEEKETLRGRIEAHRSSG